MPEKDPQDEGRALAERLLRRDADALARLYDRFGRAAYIRIYHIVRNETVAEDLVQETFLQVWNRIDQFNRARGSLGCWILRIAHNRAIDYLRSREAQVEQNAVSLDELASFDIRGPEPAGFDLFESLRAAFDRLTLNQRTVLELAYVEGLSHVEMADRLQRPLGTVKTWVRTALDLLRAEVR